MLSFTAPSGLMVASKVARLVTGRASTLASHTFRSAVILKRTAIQDNKHRHIGIESPSQQVQRYAVILGSTAPTAARRHVHVLESNPRTISTQPPQTERDTLLGSDAAYVCPPQALRGHEQWVCEAVAAQATALLVAAAAEAEAEAAAVQQQQWWLQQWQQQQHQQHQHQQHSSSGRSSGSSSSSSSRSRSSRSSSCSSSSRSSNSRAAAAAMVAAEPAPAPAAPHSSTAAVVAAVAASAEVVVVATAQQQQQL